MKEKNTNIETILGGDFNCVLDNTMDRKNCSGDTDIGQIEIKQLMNNHDLEDVWRRRYPTSNE